MKLSFKSNLRLGLGLSLILLVISSLASYISIKNLIRNADMVSHTNQVINNVNQIISFLKDAETGQRGYLLTGNAVFLEPYNGAKEKIMSTFNEVKIKTLDNPYQQRKIKELQRIIDNRFEVINETIIFKRNKGSISEASLLAGKVYMDDARRIIKDMEKEETRLLAIRNADLTKISGYTPFLIILAAILSLLITIFFYRKVAADFDVRVELQRKLEILNKETDQRIQVIQGIARQISSGDYNVRLDDEAKDGLGNLSGSLNAMAESLQYSFGLLEDKEWLQSGIAKLNDQMVGEKDLKTLANDMLTEIVAHTKSHVAALYVLEDDKNLYLTGSYALNADSVKDKIVSGQGLIGQCLQSEKLILIQDIPAGEITISYATGQTQPKNVVAFPLHRDGFIIGVIELASLNEYTPRKLEFLNSISGNIGIAIHVAQNRKKLQDFLEETQAQAEELQAQHSELEGLNAELEAQTQKIQASEEELRVQQEELLQSNQELEERTSLLEEKNQLIQERNLDIQQKAEQLEQSTKYKSEFLANMSHELRTPLNSILLLSKLMADNEDLEKEYTEYAAVIQSSGQGLLSLIDEILDLSKIEAGKMSLEVGDVTVEEVVTDMQSLFNPIAKDKKLDLEVFVNSDVPKQMNTDKMRLEQILKNLLSNAFKFTTEGKVKLSVNADLQYKTLIFKVKDTGIGIAKEKLNMVFEAFQQADGSTRRKFGGTGLGLSISRELAKLLGGEIRVVSDENVGSEFTLILPINFSDNEAFLEEQASNKEEEIKSNLIDVIEPIERFTVDHIPGEIEDDRNDIKSNDKVILIIEDDTMFAKTLLGFTRKRNYKGIVAVRGDVGIELANQFNPLAILLDIQLPIKDGWQVMEELKSNPKTRPIPVHIMSSLSVKRESLLKGAVDFIDKPVALDHMKQIFEKLEEALSRHPKKVLIVEENQQHAKALSYFLSSSNIQTLVVENVNQSIEALKRKEVECVILDMGIPDKNAYETLETIKKSEGLEHLPIIIFTGKSISKGEESRIKQYADSIVVKTAHSYQRILDEAGLFLHLVEEKGKHTKPLLRDNLGGLNEVLKDKVVLIADDDVRNIFSLTKALEQHQMKILPAVDGKEALKVLAENPKVDVVLMDMMMPELDGYQTTTLIRQMPAYKHLPILAVTAKAMMGDREKCISAGASDYISKPVDVDQLVSLLRVWLYDRV
ncbi:response regulator [Pedobacter frigiditerrae]|uniref:histidine kinase n=1 Tax=Pedobacter frigiditerrae TaxID=2530452 RepID=A0A4R0N3B4_9SPHI|nr:response regulator [Pedobacter frigiditerrae]TCC93847.1 response regulator [Pedobacter frigiditerrae]